MEVRISKLAKEMSLSFAEIIRIIQELGYSCENNPNSKVPEDVANFIRGHCCLDLDKLLSSELLQEKGASSNEFVPFTYCNVVSREAPADKPNGMAFDRERPKGFVIEELLLDSFGELQKIKLTNTTPEEDSAYYSIMIGMNGVGKSRLLREVVDFIVDLQSFVLLETNGALRSKPGKLRGIRYQSDGRLL